MVLPRKPLLVPRKTMVLLRETLLLPRKTMVLTSPSQLAFHCPAEPSPWHQFPCSALLGANQPQLGWFSLVFSSLRFEK